MKKCEYLKESEIKALCTRAKEILLEESNVQYVESPVTVSFNSASFPNKKISMFNDHNLITYIRFVVTSMVNSMI